MFFWGMVNVMTATADTKSKESGLQLEYLDRGLVAATTPEGVFLSWRLRGNEITGKSQNGLTGINFNIYRDGKKIATVINSTNYLDKGATASAKYYVCAVYNGKEIDQSRAY